MRRPASTQPDPGDWDGAGVTARPQRRPNLYLRLTSYGWQAAQPTLAQQERTRRSQLASYLLLTILLPVLTLVPDAANGDRGAGVALVLVLAGMPIALILNRLGRGHLAGALMVCLVFGATLGAIIAATDPVHPERHGLLSLIYLPAWDIFSIAIVLAVAVLPRWAVWPAMLAAAGLTVGDLLLQPLAPDLAYYKATEGPLPLVLRPIALFGLVALIAYLQARSVDQANSRALHAVISEYRATQAAADAEQESALVQYILDQTQQAAGVALVQGAASPGGASQGGYGSRGSSPDPWNQPAQRLPTPAHVRIPIGYAAGRFGQYASVFNHLFQQLRQNKAAAGREAMMLPVVLTLTRIIGDARMGRAIAPHEWPQATGYEPVDSLIHAVATIIASGPARQ